MENYFKNLYYVAVFRWKVKHALVIWYSGGFYLKCKPPTSWAGWEIVKTVKTCLLKVLSFSCALCSKTDPQNTYSQ